MPFRPILPYKRQDYPDVNATDNELKRYFIDEFQRIENSLDTSNNVIENSRSDDGVTKTRVDQLEVDLGTANAAITSEQTARATADSALASDITTVTATVNQQGTDIAAAQADITSEQTARATADSALASDITTVTATVNQQGTDIAAAQADITSEQTARATADSALASDITTVTATVNQQGTDIAAAQADITSEQTARATADSALASDITTVTATVNQQGTDIAAAQADITSEQTARASADSALASDITSLTSTVNQNGTNIAAAQADITSEATTRASADSALASDITSLTSTVNQNGTNIAAAQADITSEASTRATADSALASDITSLTSTVNQHGTDITAAQADITSEASTRATADSALASDITSLTSTVNGVSASVTIEATTRATADSNLSSDIASAASAASSAQTTANAAASAASSAQSTADGKIVTFYQNSQPSANASDTGDIWFDTNDGNKIYRFNGSSWQEAKDTNIAVAINNAATANSAAASAATAAAAAQTTANAAASAAAQADTDAAAAQSTADGKIVTFFQNSQPSNSNSHTGDIWFDTDDGNKVYRYNGSTWLSAKDTEIGTALSDAATAQTTANAAASAASAAQGTANSASSAASAAQSTADGKIVTFYQNSQPSTSVSATGDIWFDTDDGNKVYRYNGSSWASAKDADIGTALSDAAAAQTTANASASAASAAQAAANAAQTNAALANALAASAESDAATAQATADGKVTTFYQNNAPTAEGVGDLWIDTNDNNKLYRWSGSSWASVKDGTITDLESRYGIGLNVDGFVTGFVQNNDGTTGSFAILADEFKVVDPNGGPNGTQKEVFSIDNGLVRINNARVGTSILDTNAVSQQAYAYTSGSLYGSDYYNSTTKSSYTTAQSVTHTASNNPVLLMFSLTATVGHEVTRPYNPDYGKLYVNIYRGSTLIAELGPAVARRNPTLEATDIQFGGTIIDSSPGTGSKTYYLKTARQGDTAQASKRSLIALELKR